MAKNIADIIAHEPADALIFKGPFDKTFKRTLVIRSLTEKDVAFKMKTTSPELFCVRPNVGILSAKSSVNIKIYMQPTTLSLTPNLFEKRHKFLILASEVTDHVDDVHQFFRGLDSTKVWEGRVRCELTNNLDASIRHTAGGETTEVSDRVYDALAAIKLELQDKDMLQKKVDSLEKVRQDLTQEIKELRDPAQKGKKVRKLLRQRSPNRFMFLAGLLIVGAIIFFGNYGNAILKLFEQAF
ncbi:GL25412 [Drosophila persimilis]|uniref:GL25412 n=1 Tax=Drosophila persimilis TaxID=7234 RepID=B4H8Q7_DROPE|nr:vesicle-associated membrane protein-associated protein B [Drosophila persimilis]EDW35100.1 GL25412 [Drosophila persimilis]